MMTLVVLAAAAYVFFLVQTVVSASDREYAEKRIDGIRGELAVAEQHYVDLSRSITVSLAVERGFSDATRVRYAGGVDTSAPATLSVRGR